MKIKILLLFISAFFVNNLTAQIGNLKFADIFGNNYQSNEITASGKYILIDFFTNACQSCHAIAPYIDTMHRDFGCDCGDIFFVAMNASYASTNEQVFDFTQNFGVNFTAVSAQGASASIAEYLGVHWTPFFVLIDTNNNVILDTTYYISNYYKLKDTLLLLGITETFCCGAEIKYYELRTDTDTFIGEIDIQNKKISVSVVEGTNLENTIPFFIASSESSVFYNENIQISGETEVDFSDSLVNYNVIAQIDTIESEWSVEINIATKQIEQQNKKIELYPNPTNGIIYFSDITLIDNVTIYNFYGEKIADYKPTNNMQDYSCLNNGIYYFVLKQGGYYFNYKIVKK